MHIYGLQYLVSYQPLNAEQYLLKMGEILHDLWKLNSFESFLLLLTFEHTVRN